MYLGAAVVVEAAGEEGALGPRELGVVVVEAEEDELDGDHRQNGGHNE